jgi:hypothetical protein
MKGLAQLSSVLLLVFVLFGQASAITWFPQEFECPIDKEKNTFMVWGSYGSYVYHDPSKYQWLFFPWTWSEAYYICKKCHLATFIGEFDKLPKDKLPAIKKILEGVKVSQDFKEYRELPVSERMEIIEKVYSVLEKNDDWWENFYRLKGFHYGKEKNNEKASESRRKSLELLQKDLKNGQGETPKKIVLYVSGAMKHFLNDDKGAIEDLQKALNTKYQQKDAKPEELKDAEEGMNDRIKDYISKIKSEKEKPRLFDDKAGDH